MPAVLTAADLGAAWEKIFARDLRDEVLSTGVRGFARDAEDRVERLATALSDGSWRPGTLTPVSIPKSDGGTRELHVPTVADRVVETALQPALMDAIDPLLGPWCLGYRPGLGVADAVNAVTTYRSDGYTAVVRADIDDCFPSIDRGIVRRMLHPLLTDQVRLIVNQFLERRVWSKSARSPVLPPRGIPQGSPLSPMLANLVLSALDDDLAGAGYGFVRYADDVVVCCRSNADARAALVVVRTSLGRLGMRLGEEDTEVMSFDDGFAFVGEEFGPRYPPHLSSFKVRPQLGRTLYVARPGCRVSIDEGQVKVDAEGVEVLAVPTSHVARIAVFGPAGLSAGVRSWALANGVDVALCSQRGNYLGQLVGPASSAERRLRQADQRHDISWRVQLGRGLIDGKLRHQVTMLRRFTNPERADDVDAAVNAIRRLSQMLPDAGTITEIMGLEGAAARTYFDIWPALLPAELSFSGRTRQPPMDAGNAAISWCYTVLHAEAVGALAAAGLDPAIGVLHETRDRQFALAHDLIEEFRPLVVDAAIFALARAGDLRDDHGREEGSGILLTAEGRRRVAAAYENRMTTIANGALSGFRGSYRRLLHEQAERLAVCVDTASEAWRPLAWR